MGAGQSKGRARALAAPPDADRRAGLGGRAPAGQRRPRLADALRLARRLWALSREHARLINARRRPAWVRAPPPGHAGSAWPSRATVLAYRCRRSRPAGGALRRVDRLRRCHSAALAAVTEVEPLPAKLGDEPRPAPATSSRTTASARRSIHAVPRTVTDGDRALYTALYPTRFALASSDEFARACGLPRSPLDDLAAFHVVFGKTVPDVSLNAVANLGYAEGRFLAPVYPGDTLTAVSEVIGLRETSNRQERRRLGAHHRLQPARRAGARATCRWVMVRKRDAGRPGARAGGRPTLADAVAAARAGGPAGPRLHPLRLRARRRAAGAGATTRSASASTTSTG